jgi:rifampicin phosphotransferase
MGKLEQLQDIRAAGLPTPAFKSLSWETWRDNRGVRVDDLTFPLAVRSTYADEDTAASAKAGQYRTELDVAMDGLPAAIDAVFDAYPDPVGSRVILQEMIDPEISGVLFAFRNAVWKVEWTRGQGEALVSGKRTPQTFLLPRFGRVDHWLSRGWRFWSGANGLEKGNRRAFIQLSVLTSRLFSIFPEQSGLDIEFAIRKGRVYILQARPVTTDWEAEEVLTAANHREILPPDPSPFMTGIIRKAGPELYGYYQSIDSSLPNRSFIVEAAGMPWINLSALLDTMIAWGLPTALVSRSVGAYDVYRVGIRPWRMLSKIGVFWQLARQPFGVRQRVRQWVLDKRGRLHWHREERRERWREDPAGATRHWIADFSRLYTELVEHMQQLTAAMSGPVQILDRMGLLSKNAVTIHQKSRSTDYFRAFRHLRSGGLDRKTFVQRFGHRGFYESDIGKRRFYEFSEQDWSALTGKMSVPEEPTPEKEQKNRIVNRLFHPINQLIHTREWLRHVCMYFFWEMRKEMLEQMRSYLPSGVHFADLSPEELLSYLSEEKTSAEILQLIEHREPASGWDLNTFLANGKGRRLVLPEWSAPENQEKVGIGIYPGIVEGVVWRVHRADVANLQPPPAKSIILVADALDPGWVPYFDQVDGVLAYVGGLLSHASIMLREAGIPAITQLPETISLKTGDYIRMNGQSGEVELLEQKVRMIKYS